ncbi:hypothetical protein HJ526_13915 [Donghicola sp. C2-DW-16]|uniref:DUF982 domain-containing protein n=1 Tax=Donghicola mangrovi TaxID=2729614 RepID=A0ABX2PHP1_9RHOB|nr:hypothetical protein [Donghicola mangrovi]NVO28522.1 hypothetical protein [Donghicola mangrovi]
MNLNQIVVGLSAAPVSHSDPARLARAGFLQWCLTLEDRSDMRHAARAAIARLHCFVNDSEALAQFHGLLIQAAEPPSLPRRTGARRRLTRLQ